MDSDVFPPPSPSVFCEQSVNPKLTLPYWDFTIEDYEAEMSFEDDDLKIDSPIFQKDWFGSADPVDNVVSAFFGFAFVFWTTHIRRCFGFPACVLEGVSIAAAAKAGLYNDGCRSIQPHLLKLRWYTMSCLVEQWWETRR